MNVLEWAGYFGVVAYVVGFLAMTNAAARRAGRPVWLFSKGSEAQAVPAALFRMAFAGAVVWPPLKVMVGEASRADPITRILDGPWTDGFGLLGVVVGAALALTSQRIMGASWRIGAATGQLGELVTAGPFALSRNPVFVGQVLLFVGLFLLLPDAVQAALTAALLVAVGWQVRIEERVLLLTLGRLYADYCRRTPRWLGVLRRR